MKDIVSYCKFGIEYGQNFEKKPILDKKQLMDETPNWCLVVRSVKNNTVIYDMYEKDSYLSLKQNNTENDCLFLHPETRQPIKGDDIIEF